MKPELVIQHSDALFALIRSARTQLTVVSPWIQESVVEKILEAVPASTELEVVIRWPQRPDTPGFLDQKAVELLVREKRAGAAVAISVVREALHAKVYCADSRGAIVTSANLSGRGIGSSQPANIELGVQVHSEAAAVRQWLNTLKREPLTESGLKELRRWAEIKPYKNKLKYPVLPNPSRDLARQHAIQILVETGFSKQATPIKRGAGRFAYELVDVAKPSTAKMRVGLRTSLHGQGVAEQEYHFELTKKDLDRYLNKNGRQRTLDGILLAPVDRVKREIRLAPAVPLVVVPLGRVLDRHHGVQKRAFEEHGKLKFAVKQHASRRWRATVLNATGRGWTQGSAVMELSMFRGGTRIGVAKKPHR